MAEALWTREELTAALGGGAGALPDAVTGVSIDSRTLAPGDVFFAIKGERSDGHAYLPQAFAAGAALAVVSEAYAGAADGPLLRVPDTLQALEALGRASRARSAARIVAVTGSVGKTGTKEMLRLLLARLGATHASDKSYNNHWGVPLSLARLPRASGFAVFEIGMNHAGEITPLTKLVRPHVAIVTTVGPVHIEFFDSVEGIAEAKGEIFRGLEPDGAAILNRDNEHFDLLAIRAGECGAGRVIGFGKSEEAQARLLALTAEGGGSQVEADIMGERLRYRVGAPGEHLAMNSIAALAAVKTLDGALSRAAPGLAGFGAPAGRGAQTVHAVAGGEFLLLDESYNANPTSMRAAFAVLGLVPAARAARRIAVLGDMLELGANGLDLHRGLAGPIAEAGIDRVYCCGPLMRALDEALPQALRGGWAADAEGLKDVLLDAIRAGDAIMIKGSLGSRMGLLVEAIKQRYPSQGGEKTAGN
jgi:UDP-N-acetylmuramoyl-tripeptide--D-alanyl-D-alanine ligase